MKFNQIVLVSLVVWLMLLVGYAAIVPVQAQSCDPLVAFSVTPFRQLQATALCGNTPPGEVDFYVDGAFFQHFSIPALNEFETLYLALDMEIPTDYETWAITGTWSQHWPLTVPTSVPPDYVTPTPQLPPPNSTPPAIPSDEAIQVITGRRFIDTPAGSVNVRNGPGITYAQIGYLNQGDAIQLTGRYGLWYRINYGGQTGWVYAPLTSSNDPTCSNLATWWHRWRCHAERLVEDAG